MSCLFSKNREDGLRSHSYPPDSIFRSAFTYNTEREFSNNYAISKSFLRIHVLISSLPAA